MLVQWFDGLCVLENKNGSGVAGGGACSPLSMRERQTLLLVRLTPVQGHALIGY